MNFPSSSVSHHFLPAKWRVEEAGVLYFWFSIALGWEIKITKQTPRKKNNVERMNWSNYKRASEYSFKGRHHSKETEQSRNCALGTWEGAKLRKRGFLPNYSSRPLRVQAQVWENRSKDQGLLWHGQRQKDKTDRLPSCLALIWGCRDWVGTCLECRWGCPAPSSSSLPSLTTPSPIPALGLPPTLPSAPPSARPRSPTPFGTAS